MLPPEMYPRVISRPLALASFTVNTNSNCVIGSWYIRNCCKIKGILLMYNFFTCPLSLYLNGLVTVSKLHQHAPDGRTLTLVATVRELPAKKPAVVSLVRWSVVVCLQLSKGLRLIYLAVDFCQCVCVCVCVRTRVIASPLDHFC